MERNSNLGDDEFKTTEVLYEKFDFDYVFGFISRVFYDLRKKRGKRTQSRKFQGIEDIADK